MPNRLARETSPYLRQHADNPVDWYPFSDEAFARAKSENKPILLSIGYSACHWCHVMAHESFEDEETARLMNDRYVSVKVDREEMPDVDQIYQQALQLQGEHGGWPLTMFLTPDGTPFFGGTYFPKRDNFGRPGFKRILTALSDAFAKDLPAVESNAQQFREGLAHLATHGRARGDEKLLHDATQRAAAKLALNVDRREGGFGGAPKFPNPKAFELMLRGWRHDQDPELLQGVTRTLLKMAAGGIYDQIGGGFARYSTDAVWLVPHFEKMLYDNAQLLVLYAEAWQVTREPAFERICVETHGWIEREMRSPEGGLYTALDADSEGVEGKYYVWNPAEVRALSGEGAEVVMRCLDVREGGNWRDPHGHGPENASILHVVDAPRDEKEAVQLKDARIKLLEARQKRVPPGTDDKMLASVNGLAIAGLAEAGRIFGRKEMIDSARRTAEFVLGKLRAPDGRLLRTYKEGVAKLPGTLEDHAYVADGLIALYEATGERRWLEEAHRLTKLALELFYHAGERAFYMTAEGDPGLIQRPVSQYDSAVPSGMSVCLENLVRLGDVASETKWLEIADGVFQAYFVRALENPFGFSNLLNALDLFLERPAEIVAEAEPLLRAIAGVYLPNRVLVRQNDAPDFLKSLVEGKDPALAYVCRNFTCERPTSDPAALQAQLTGERR
jgi:uncharacterized protein YyaL (SSP411 family)